MHYYGGKPRGGRFTFSFLSIITRDVVNCATSRSMQRCITIVENQGGGGAVVLIILFVRFCHFVSTRGFGLSGKCDKMELLGLVNG